MPDLRASVRRCSSSANSPGGSRIPPLRGFLPYVPRVGEPLILYTPEPDGGVARLITSAVQRVLMDPGGLELFVETRRTTYVVRLEEPLRELVRPPRLRVTFDGFEMTVTSDSRDGADEADDTGDAG
jgi:hypothetical protein